MNTLPYRTTAEELARHAEHLAKGRISRPVGIPEKTLEGNAASAAALGLVSGSGELSDFGRRFALADPAGRPSLLAGALRSYPPYTSLLSVIAETGAAQTTLDWVQRWWSTRGFGGSASNRAEAATTFGRLAEAVGWCRYVAGRRGHPTRLEWSPDAFGDWRDGAASQPRSWPAGQRPDGDPAPRISPVRSSEPIARDSTPPSAAGLGGDSGVQREQVDIRAPAEAAEPAAAAARMSAFILEFADNVTAELRVPTRLPAAEKRRLLQLIDLLIRTDPAS